MDPPKARWLDCQEIARRVWPDDMAQDDSLEIACDLFAYDFIPGDALQDAKAIGAVFLQAIKESGVAAGGWELYLEKEGE